MILRHINRVIIDSKTVFPLHLQLRSLFVWQLLRLPFCDLNGRVEILVGRCLYLVSCSSTCNLVLYMSEIKSQHVSRSNKITQTYKVRIWGKITESQVPRLYRLPPHHRHCSCMCASECVFTLPSFSVVLDSSLCSQKNSFGLFFFESHYLRS